MSESFTGKSEETEKLKIPNFEIVTKEGEFVHENEVELEEGVIVHFKKVRVLSPESGKDVFILKKNISGYDYNLGCYKSVYGDYYTLLMTTEGHKYARTQLDPDALEELAKIRAGFLNSIAISGIGDVHEVQSEPFDGSYTVEQIDQCAQEIVDSGKSMYKSKDELTSRMNGNKLFNFYYQIFGKNFQTIEQERDNKSKARGRLFRMMFKKYLPEESWEIEETGVLNGIRLLYKPKE